MMRACKQTGILSLAVLLLTACGGGGGAANVGAPEPASPRSLFPGSTAPSMTAAQLHDRVTEGLAAFQGADADLLVSDISLFEQRADLDLPLRINSRCLDTGVCSYTFEGRTVTVGVEDLTWPAGTTVTPVMDYRDIRLLSYAYKSLETAISAASDDFGYGGMLEHSAFFAEGSTITSGDFRGVTLYAGVSVGLPSGSRPTGVEARWSGVMVATDVVGEGRGNRIQGDADMTYDFDSITADLLFSRISDLETGNRRPDIRWDDMPVLPEGVFGSLERHQGETLGRFYGPGHVEAGGTFTHGDLSGAYGMKRQ